MTGWGAPSPSVRRFATPFFVIAVHFSRATGIRIIVSTQRGYMRKLSLKITKQSLNYFFYPGLFVQELNGFALTANRKISNALISHFPVDQASMFVIVAKLQEFRVKR